MTCWRPLSHLVMEQTVEEAGRIGVDLLTRANSDDGSVWMRYARLFSSAESLRYARINSPVAESSERLEHIVDPYLASAFRNED
jgi:hypothetical protein